MGRSILKYSLRYMVAICLLGYLASRVDLKALWQTFLGAQFEYTLIAIALIVGQGFYSAYRWLILLRCSSSRAEYTDLVNITFASGFYGMFLPGGSIEMMRVVGQSRKSKDAAFAFSSVVLDRLLGVFALSATTLIALTMVSLPFGFSVALWAASVFLISICLYLASINRWIRRLCEWFLRPKFFKMAREKYQKLLASIDAMHSKKKTMFWALTHAFGIQVLRVVAIIFGAQAFAFELPLGVYFAYVPLIVFVQLLPISVGGFGTREAAYVLLFGSVGIAEERALSLSFLMYFSGLVAVFPGAWLGHSAFSKPDPQKMDPAKPKSISEP